MLMLIFFCMASLVKDFKLCDTVFGAYLYLLSYQVFLVTIHLIPHVLPRVVLLLFGKA